MDSFSELIYYRIHFLAEPDSENHHIGVHGAEEYSAMPRFHSSSGWFFLVTHRETDMAIATDVNGDDGCALSAPLEPLKVMPIAVMAKSLSYYVSGNKPLKK